MSSANDFKRDHCKTIKTRTRYARFEIQEFWIRSTTFEAVESQKKWLTTFVHTTFPVSICFDGKLHNVENKNNFPRFLTLDIPDDMKTNFWIEKLSKIDNIDEVFTLFSCDDDHENEFIKVLKLAVKLITVIIELRH